MAASDREVMRVLRLMILDDEAVICKTLEMMVHRMESIKPVETVIAYEGSAALEILERQQIDIALVDISLGEMDGLTFIEKAMECDNCPQIIVISAYGDYSYVRGAFKFGAFDYIMKPVEFEVFEATLQKCADRIEADRKNPRDMIDEIKKYIANNIENNISMGQVSRHVAMDYSYFSKYFKRMTGKSFTEFLTDEKMKYCKKLLAESNIKINELAWKMGYNNTGNFSRAFRNYTGKWPTEYKDEIESRRNDCEKKHD